MSSGVEVSGLYHGPIKSCARVEVNKLAITERGPRLGRHWMVVDHNGKFMIFEDFPKMVQIEPVLEKDKLVLTAQGVAEQVEIPITDCGERIVAKIWERKYDVVNDGYKVARWLSGFLDVECRLVHLPEDVVRKDDREIARFELADSYAETLASTASLDLLNEKIIENGGSPKPMGRFRPDIVVSGTEPFAEDAWAMIIINGLRFAVIKPVVRCNRTRIKYECAVPGYKPEMEKEPLKTLNTFRRIKTEEKKYGVIFAQKMAHLGIGTINIGDTVEVLEYKDPPQLIVK